MKKHLVITVVGMLAVFVVAVYSASAQGKPSFGCSPAFDFYVTTTQAAELPRSQLAIDDGLITKPDLIAVYRTRFDKNGNDMVCVKEVPGWEPGLANKPGVEYFYNFVDDSSSSSNG